METEESVWEKKRQRFKDRTLPLDRRECYPQSTPSVATPVALDQAHRHAGKVDNCRRREQRGVDDGDGSAHASFGLARLVLSIVGVGVCAMWNPLFSSRPRKESVEGLRLRFISGNVCGHRSLSVVETDSCPVRRLNGIDLKLAVPFCFTKTCERWTAEGAKKIDVRTLLTQEKE